ncbi:hypothetical protein N9N28_11330 [Rubripirellula amarantea]|nr:hypothetical protein [Rubripirellula amarantea]
MSIEKVMRTLAVLLWGSLASISIGSDSTSEPGYVWKNVTIRGGGFVTGIITSPAEEGVMYARTDVGGAYRWNASDESWIPITDMFGVDAWHLTGIESLAVDPSNASRVYLAAGIYNNSYVPNGEILRSDDRGHTWDRTKMPFGMGGNEAGRGNGERLAVDPADGNVLFFGSRDAGLWKSIDAAKTWNKVDSFPSMAESDDAGVVAWGTTTQAVGIINVTFVPTKGEDETSTQTIYAAVSSLKPGWFRSDDGGETWSLVEGQPSGSRVATAALSSDRKLYVTYSNKPSPIGSDGGSVWRHDIDQGTWQEITPLVPGPENGDFGYGGISVSRANPSTVITTTLDRWGRDEVFFSQDAGETWISTSEKAVRDPSECPWLANDQGHMEIGHWMSDIEIDPFDDNKVCYVTGAGIIGSSNLTDAARNQATYWKPQVKGLEETVPLALLSPAEGAALISAVGDIGGFKHDSVDDLVSRSHRNPRFSNTTSLATAVSDPKLVVRAGHRNWGDNESATIAYSLDGGQSWQPAPSLPEPDVNQGHVAVSADGQVWVWSPEGGEGTVWRTADHGQNWTSASGLKGRLRPHADPVDSDVFYATDNSKGFVYVSVDKGKSFTRSASELPEATYWSTMVPVAGRRGYLIMGTKEGVFASTDAGASFDKVGELTEVVSLGQGKSASEGELPTLFGVGKLDGVQGFYRSSDGGKSWIRINDDRHQFGEIRVVAGDPKRFGRVYIGTGGRGIIYGDIDAN